MLSRRSLLAGTGAAAAAFLAGCSTGPVRLSGVGPIPTPPPFSPGESARRQAAAGARAALDAFARIDPATLPGDLPSRVPGWVQVHRAHLTALADPPRAPGILAPATRGAPAVLAAGDPTAQLGAILVTGVRSAAAAAPSAGAIGPLLTRLAGARDAQDRLLRSRLAIPVTEQAWPDPAPVDLLQALLTAEHAAVDGYTTASAWAAGRRADLVAGTIRHEDARDSLAAAVTAAGGTPVPAAAGYAVPPEVQPGGPAAADPDTRAVTLAMAVETGVARACVAAVAAFLSAPADGVPLVDSVRAVAVRVGAAEAARQLFGAEPDPLPGG